MTFNRCWLHNGFSDSKIMESQKEFEIHWACGWRHSPADIEIKPDNFEDVDTLASENCGLETNEGTEGLDPCPWSEIQAHDTVKRPRGRPRKVM